MDIIIRIIIMILCEIAIIKMIKALSQVYNTEEPLNAEDKIFIYGIGFMLNWFIIMPGFIFMKCFEYLIHYF